MPSQWDKLTRWFRPSRSDPTPEVAVKSEAEWVYGSDDDYGPYPSPSFRHPTLESQFTIPRPKRTAHRVMVGASTSLGLRLHQHLAEEKPETNLVVSPASVSVAMAMAAFGAHGVTRDELAHVLGIEGIPIGELRACYAELLQTLHFAAQEQELRIANSVWVTDTRKILPEYEQALQECLEAKATSLPFSDLQSVERINRWVEEKTNGRIGGILDSLSEEQRLLLINCVYFKGIWDQPFEKTRTKDKTFHGAGGDRQRPFMHMRSGFPYLEDADGQAVCLKYGGLSSLEMWIFLPARKVGLQRFLDSLQPTFWTSVQNKSQHRSGTVALPRFKVECSNDLNSGLQAAGIQRAFDPDRADFGGMLVGIEPLFISEALQKTYLEVNEEGTEAAAATLMTVTFGAALQEEPPKPFEMIVDRPFFVAVGDSSSGLLLFTASVWEV